MTKLSAAKIMDIAQEILRDKGQGHSLPTSLNALLDGETLELVPISTPQQFDGRLELCCNRPTIFINLIRGGWNHPRVRFTLGHELGHFFLHRRLLRKGHIFHDDKILFGPDLKDVEQEANAFASECLLPSPLVTRRLGSRLLNLAFVQDIAAESLASLQATAIKIASLTSNRCCFFWEEEGAIQWTAPSDDWIYSRHRWSAWRGALPTMSEASSTPDSFDERKVDFQAWCPNSNQREDPLFESAHATSFGRLILVFDPGTEDESF